MTTREELLNRVAQITPLLRDTAATSEQNNTLCEPAVQALREAGLFGLWTPVSVGGSDNDFVTQVEVMIKLAQADMSACWATMIGASSTAVLSGLPARHLAEVFVGDHLPTAAVSLRPSGLATKVDGGYRATGSWGFGSGIKHAGWIVGNCLVADGDKPAQPPQVVMLVVPIDQVDVADDWQVAGLSGSGSHSYAISDVFVPFHRVVGAPRATSPNADLQARIPLEHASVSLGGARHAIDEITSQARHKMRMADAKTVASQQAFQIELGKWEAEWATLQASVLAVANELWHATINNDPDLKSLQLKTRAICAWATERSLFIGGQVLRQAGAGAVLNTNVLQRIYRDLTVSAQHTMVSDAAYENLGSALVRNG